jgi:hypothetical protein
MLKPILFKIQTSYYCEDDIAQNARAADTMTIFLTIILISLNCNCVNIIENEWRAIVDAIVELECATPLCDQLKNNDSCPMEFNCTTDGHVTLLYVYMNEN